MRTLITASMILLASPYLNATSAVSTCMNYEGLSNIVRVGQNYSKQSVTWGKNKTQKYYNRAFKRIRRDFGLSPSETHSEVIALMSRYGMDPDLVTASDWAGIKAPARRNPVDIRDRRRSTSQAWSNRANEENLKIGDSVSSNRYYTREAALRGHYAKNYLRDNPNSWSQVKNNTLSSDDRLAQHLGISQERLNFLKEKNKIRTKFKGGEANLYLSKDKKTALKIWHVNRLKDFEDSVDEMIALAQMVKSNPKLSQYMHVSQITEKGPGYIVKEFIESGVELSKVIKNPVVRSTIIKLKKELSRNPNPLTAQVLAAIRRNPPSNNLFWNPNTNRVVLIDSLGF